MEHFWKSTGTITSEIKEGLVPKDIGFEHFDSVHIAWIAALVIIVAAVSLLYRKSGARTKRIMRYTVAGLVIGEEIIKDLMLIITDQWSRHYFPFHLCTINVFIIAAHVIKPSKVLNNFLYGICIPAAIAAMLFPTWTKLPPLNFMHIHGFTTHILLTLYPVMLTVGGDIIPSAKQIPNCIVLLEAMAVPIYFFNYYFDTNYMFLMRADAGNPLGLFEEAFGTHIIGVPIILAAVLLVMYLPWETVRFIKRKRAKRACTD